MQSVNPAAAEPATRAAPTSDDIRAELERILASGDFQASERRRAFLRFIVGESLAGRSGRLKGYTVAVSVFGRDESFDAQTDPVVRLEARRLRRDLDSYYVSAGRNDPVMISIPKGSYIPRFDRQEAEPALGGEDPQAAVRTRERAPEAAASPGESARGRAKPVPALIAAALCFVVTIGGAGLWYLGAPSIRSGAVGLVSEPAIVISPFEALGPAEEGRQLAEGIRQELIGDLMQFRGLRVYSTHTGRDPAGRDAAGLGRNLGVAYVVTGSVMTAAERVHLSSQLIDAETGRVLWTGRYEEPLTPATFIRVLEELSAQIATVLGQPYGLVANDLRRRGETQSVSSMQSYICVLRAYGYRRNFSRAEYAPVFACLEAAVRRDPDYSDAWAMLGWLHLDAGRYEFFGPNEMEAQYQAAFSAASRALALEPDSTLALKALSSINHYMGRFDEGERLARRAMALNPHDPDTLAQLGWRLAVRGNFKEGIVLLDRAIERSVNPPGWYFHLIAVSHCLNHDYERMLRVAERSAADGSAVSQALIAIASAELGNPGVARAALAAMSAFEPLARDPAAYFRRHGATDEIVDALVGGLAHARQVAERS